MTATIYAALLQKLLYKSFEYTECSMSQFSARYRFLTPKNYTLDLIPDLEKMLENGEHAVHLKADQFKSFVESNKYVFANFYAPWCVWCQVSCTPPQRR